MSEKEELTLICPISQQSIKNPVIADDGQTYEKRYIMKWLCKSSISPVTRKSISRMLIPNLFARQWILSKNPKATFDNRELWEKLGNNELSLTEINELLNEDINDIIMNFSIICKVNDKNIFEILIKNNFEWDMEINGKSVLFYLIECLETNREMNYLLEKLVGIKSWLRYNKKGINPLIHIFKIKNLNISLTNALIHQHIGRYALKDNKNNTILHYSVQYCSDIVNTLLLRLNFKNLNVKNKRGNTPLHIAVQFSSENLCFELINKMKDTLEVKNKIGNTPLFIALQFKSDEIALELLKNTTNFNLKNKHNNTLLHIATQFSGIEVIKKIVENCDAFTLVSSNNYGNTPLHNAYKYNTQEVIDYLKRKGSDDTIKNNDGYIPSDYAKEE